MSRNAAGSSVVASIPPIRAGADPRRREPDAGSIASYRSGRRCGEPLESGFTVAKGTADTIGDGHAEAGHDQSGNVGGRGSTVPRFENPNRPARQAVPPLRQAGRVLHALHLEAAGQPGTAPRPLLPVPSCGARRLTELRKPRRVTLDAAGSSPRPQRPVRCHVQASGNRTAIRVHCMSSRPRWSGSRTLRSTKGAVVAGQSTDLVGRNRVHRASASAGPRAQAEDYQLAALEQADERAERWRRDSMTVKPAARTRMVVSELDRRPEEAYRADAVEAERINREWEEVDADIATLSRRARTRAPARKRPSPEARSTRT